MTSCPEAMGWEFGDFEKDVSWDSTMGRANPAGGLTVDDVGDSWFVCLNQTVDVEVWSWSSADL